MRIPRASCPRPSRSSTIARYVLNSALLAGSVTLISVLLNGMAGYAFAKLRFAGRDGIYRVLAGAMVIPGQVTMLPLFLMVKELGLVNTYAGAMVPWLASIFGIFLVRQYTFSLPEDLLDAARVDGASEWRIFRSVVVPVIRPILLTLAVFTFMGAWNDFLWPLIVLSRRELYTLQIGLNTYAGELNVQWHYILAMTVVTMIPVVVVFVFLQRFITTGIAGAGVK
jgi:ABC-type glycerol-3-phosphate transport system permease component